MNSIDLINFTDEQTQAIEDQWKSDRFDLFKNGWFLRVFRVVPDTGQKIASDWIQKQLQSLARAPFSAQELKVGPIRLWPEPLGASPGRLAEWWTGRLALIEASRGLSPEFQPLLSLTHSHGLVAALVGPLGSEIIKVGIDLESISRPVSQRAQDRYVTQTELIQTGLTPLEAWVVKEACYKANGKGEGSPWLNHYVLSKMDGAMGPGQVQMGQEVFEFQCLKIANWILGVAWQISP